MDCSVVAISNRGWIPLVISADYVVLDVHFGLFRVPIHGGDGRWFMLTICSHNVWVCIVLLHLPFQHTI